MLFNIILFMHAFSDCVVSMPPLVAWLYTRKFVLIYTERSTPLWWSTVGTFVPYYTLMVMLLFRYGNLQTEWGASERHTCGLDEHRSTTVGVTPRYEHEATQNKEACYVTQLVMIASCKAITSCALTSIKKLKYKILPLA